MLAAVGFDSALFTHAVSLGIGRIVAALAVAAVAYGLAAVAMSFMWSSHGGTNRYDFAALVLIVTLIVYLILSLRLDGAWFWIASAGLVGMAALAMVLAEARLIAARIHPRRRCHEESSSRAAFS